MSDPSEPSPLFRADPYTPEGLAKICEGEPAFRQRQITEWLTRGVDDPSEMTNLPKTLRERAEATMTTAPRILTVSEADGGLTRKVLLECGEPDTDGAEAVESVLMLYRKDTDRAGRATVCISTQAGCAMGCPFCATGQAGFRRQLTVGEVLRQVTVMQRLLAEGTDLPDGVPDHVTNVVFMGMGEPLANSTVTLAAVRWLHETFGLSARSITVSTVGLVPAIKRLQAMELPVTLAVSLHAPDDELRDNLVPINRTHPLDKLLTATREYLDTTKRRVTFEYVMIDKVNARPDQAKTLATLLRQHLRGRGSTHVNLIPMNPTPAVPWKAPPIRQQRRFAAILNDAGIPATIRANRGSEIDAACGQLYANYQMASGKTLPLAVGAADRVRPETPNGACDE